VRELRRLHGVKRSQIVGDAVSAVISEFIRRRIAKIKRMVEVAGILPTPQGGVKLVREGALSHLQIPRDPDLERARRALELLRQLRRHYDSDKFDIVINWAAVAPALYALKKLFHVKQVYLLIHGEKQTGKTTLGRIITSLYPLVTAEEEEVAEEAQSEYRLAWKLNVATTPLLEDEVQGVSRKPGLLGLLKRAATGDLVRWRGDTNRKYHARTALILTSNYTEVIEDPALAERMAALLFTQKDYVGNKSREEREEFKRVYNEYRAVAPHLGAVILEAIVEKWDVIREEWAHRLQEKRDYLELGQEIWRWTAEKLGVEHPEWAGRELELEEDRPEDRLEEAFWGVVHDVIAEYARLHKCDHTVLGCLAQLGRKGLLPNTLMEWSPAKIVVKAGILREIKRRTGIQVIGGLRNLAEKLGLDYKKVKVNGRVTLGVIIPVNTLIGKIGGEEDIVEYLAETLLIKARIERWDAPDSEKGVINRVMEEAVKLGIKLDHKTAEAVALKILDVIEEARLVEAEITA
jgi:hypothetical protein